MNASCPPGQRREARHQREARGAHAKDRQRRALGDRFHPTGGGADGARRGLQRGHALAGGRRSRGAGVSGSLRQIRQGRFNRLRVHPHTHAHTHTHTHPKKHVFMTRRRLHSENAVSKTPLSLTLTHQRLTVHTATCPFICHVSIASLSRSNETSDTWTTLRRGGSHVDRGRGQG